MILHHVFVLHTIQCLPVLERFSKVFVSMWIHTDPTNTECKTLFASQKSKVRKRIQFWFIRVRVSQTRYERLVSIKKSSQSIFLIIEFHQNPFGGNAILRQSFLSWRKSKDFVTSRNFGKSLLAWDSLKAVARASSSREDEEEEQNGKAERRSRKRDRVRKKDGKYISLGSHRDF